MLTVELLELELPMVLVLNMSDEAQKLGIAVKDKWLSEILGVRVLRTIGRTGECVKALLPNIVEEFNLKEKPTPLKYSKELEDFLDKVRERENETKAELIRKLHDDERFKEY